MSVAWVAGAVRGKALARRAAGGEFARRVGAESSLAGALRLLASSTYGERIHPGLDLEAAQRAVAGMALWHLRVLAGWLPPAGVDMMRALAGWFELANLEEVAIGLATGTGSAPAPYRLGALATAGPAASDAHSLRELRMALARSGWGDPGGEALPELLLGLRFGWGRLLLSIGEQPGWGLGALALTAAKARLLGSEGPTERAPFRIPELGSGWSDATDVEALAMGLPREARWVLRGVETRAELWRAERAWWLAVEDGAEALLRNPSLGRKVVLGAGAELLVDAWRLVTALAQSARGSAGSLEE